MGGGQITVRNLKVVGVIPDSNLLLVKGSVPGAIGSSSHPSRVFKGMRMAGRMGGGQITVRNLKVVGVIPDSNLLLVKGSVPGAINGVVEIHKNTAH